MGIISLPGGGSSPSAWVGPEATEGKPLIVMVADDQSVGLVEWDLFVERTRHQIDEGRPWNDDLTEVYARFPGQDRLHRVAMNFRADNLISIIAANGLSWTEEP